MTGRKVFLALAAALFIGWMIYLLQLAIRHQHSVVVSRPQIQGAQLIVVARIEDREKGTVRMEQLLDRASGYKGPTIEAGKSITVKNLANCDGFQPESQTYVLPLESDGDDGFKVVPIPSSPGYGGGPPRIYVDGAATRHQVDHILGRSGG
jgi:hypothetical protein